MERKELNIGDKYLKSVNPDDTSALTIITVDDVLEIDRGFNVYECTYYNFLFKGDIKDLTLLKN
jgi:hypothetical protein